MPILQESAIMLLCNANLFLLIYALNHTGKFLPARGATNLTQDCCIKSAVRCIAPSSWHMGVTRSLALLLKSVLLQPLSCYMHIDGTIAESCGIIVVSTL